MSAAIVAALAVVFLLASEQLVRLACVLRCAVRGYHVRGRVSRVGGREFCATCPASRVAVTLREWRDLQ